MRSDEEWEALSEAKDTIGGYGIIQVDDLDAAIDIAKSSPARGHKVEIRAVVSRE